MNRKRLKEAEKYASRNYSIIMSRDNLSDGSVVFMARHPELEGCKAQGATPMESVTSLRDARIDYIYFLLEDKIEIPAPISEWCTVYLSNRAC